MFDIEQMKMTSWSKKASKTGLPEQWQRLPSKVVNILFDCNNKEIVFLQSHDMFVLLDISKVCSLLHFLTTLVFPIMSIVVLLAFTIEEHQIVCKKNKKVHNW